METLEDSTKVIFTSLGPDQTYTDKFGKEYQDGDAAVLTGEDYEKAVLTAKFAQHWTQDLEERTKKLVGVAQKTRNRILSKMSARSKN